jgi:hypothetical protein
MTLVADVTTQASKRTPSIYIIHFLLISGQLLHCCQRELRKPHLLHCCQWELRKPQLLHCCQGELRKLVRVRGSKTHSNQSNQMIQHYRVRAALPIISAVDK